MVTTAYNNHADDDSEAQQDVIFSAQDIGNGSKHTRGESGRNFVNSRQVSINDFGIVTLTRKSTLNKNTVISYIDFQQHLKKYDFVH